MTPDRHADLALVPERTECGGVDRAVKVDVAENHERIVAAQLEMGTFEMPGRCLAHLASRLGGAGEGDDAHVLVGDQGLSDVSATGQDVQHTFRQSRLLEYPGEQHAS